MQDYGLSHLRFSFPPEPNGDHSKRAGGSKTGPCRNLLALQQLVVRSGGVMPSKLCLNLIGLHKPERDPRAHDDDRERNVDLEEVEAESSVEGEVDKYDGFVAFLHVDLRLEDKL